MPTPFPGMDPYLEQSWLWPGVHLHLITSIADALAPLVRPRYFVSVAERVYTETAGLTFISEPDVGILDTRMAREPVSAYATAPVGGSITVDLPMPTEIREAYLEIVVPTTGEVVTALEILSPTNKRAGEGRRIYLEKRLRTLGSLTHLIEIDLLRADQPMPMRAHGVRPSPVSELEGYRILISRAQRRPSADLFFFTVRQPIPTFALPLRSGDMEPVVDLNDILHALYDRAGYDLRIDYRADPQPPLDPEDAQWADALLKQAGLR